MKLATSSLFFSEFDFRDRFKIAEELGFEGIEIRLEENPELSFQVDQIQKALIQTDITACSLIVRSPAFRMPLISKEIMQEKLKSAKVALQIASRFKTPTILQPEYQAQSPLPLFDELSSPSPDERELLQEFLFEAVNIAEKLSATILLEPINRYESHFYHRLEEVIAICDAIHSPFLKVCADFFHMSIEEENIQEGIKIAADHISHVHLADSNRKLPGQGHTDFVSGFTALRETGYDRFLALECKKPKDLQEVAASKTFLDQCLEQSKA